MASRKKLLPIPKETSPEMGPRDKDLTRENDSSILIAVMCDNFSRNRIKDKII